jgi:hypothetical protein
VPESHADMPSLSRFFHPVKPVDDRAAQLLDIILKLLISKGFVGTTRSFQLPCDHPGAGAGEWSRVAESVGIVRDHAFPSSALAI